MEMFFDHITDTKDSEQLYGLESKWCIDIPGLVRVPFFDSAEPQYGYVVYYSEIKQQYGIVKFSTETGSLIWISSVCNGGYGTPVVYGNILVCHKEFDAIVALDKETGKELWDIKTQGRIRTSMSLYEGCCYFASSGLVYKINEEGEILNTCVCDGVFFYGNIIKYDLNILVLGVEFDDISKKSTLALFYFDLNLRILDKVYLDYSPVVSADTSGIFCFGKFALVTCYDILFKIDIVGHSIIFKKKLEGIAGRHIPISDGVAVYYTTLNGYVSSCSLASGENIWSQKTKECSIVAPPSLKGQSLFVIADGCLNVMDKKNGDILQSKVIGHAPYSASILNGNHVFIGGGEPPTYGNLLCFDIIPYNQCQNEMFSVKIFDEDVNNFDKTLLISTTKPCKEIVVNPIAIAEESLICAKTNNKTLFKLSFRLKNNCIKGYYGIPIQLKFENPKEVICTMFRLELQSIGPLPSRVFLENFAKPVEQEGDLLSGAAIAQLLMAQYGKKIEQKEFRKIIDYVKGRSRWKDADFQTWRLILKRVLSNPSYTLDEFIETESISSKEYPNEKKLNSTNQFGEIYGKER